MQNSDEEFRPPLAQRLLLAVEPENTPPPMLQMDTFDIRVRVGVLGMDGSCIGAVAVCDGMVYHKLIPVEMIHLAAPGLSADSMAQLERQWQACHEALTNQSLVSPYPNAVIYGEPEPSQFESPEVALQYLFDQWVGFYREDAKPVHQGGEQLARQTVNAVVEALRVYNPALTGIARVQVHEQDTTVATDRGIVAISSGRCSPDDLLFNTLAAMNSLWAARKPGQRAAIMLVLDDPTAHAPDLEQLADIERTRSQLARNDIETLLAVTPEQAATTLSDWLTAETAG